MSKKTLLEKKISKFINQYLNNYEFVYLTSDLRGFIKYFYPINPEEICKILISCLLKKNITVIIPSFSYTSKGVFKVENNNSNLGFLTKWAIKDKRNTRSHHPIFSFCAIGKKQKLIKSIGKAAFGNKSVFYKLLAKKTSLFHFGRPFSMGNTFIHFVEQYVNADYRYEKVFPTKVYQGKKFLGSNFSAYVQKDLLHNKIKTNTKKIANILKSKSFFKKVGSDKNLTNITHLDMKKTFKIMCQEFYKNNNIFISRI